jgi:DNA invertase Pin-like site-specific DNA recombinase
LPISVCVGDIAAPVGPNISPFKSAGVCARVLADLERAFSARIACTFLLTLRDRGVKFAAVDLPEANDLTVGIMALVAQAEREAISKRTKEALAVARSRGVRLGNPNGAAALRRAGKGGAPLRAAIGRNADRHAQDLAPVMEDIRGSGHTSLRAIAGELNARGMLTRRGGRWHVSTVMNLLDRLGAREANRARSPGPDHRA